MTNVEGRKPEGAPERSPKAGEGAASGVDGNVAKRFSVQRKMAVVARMLRGEPLELVARETNVSIARLAAQRGKSPASAQAPQRQPCSMDQLPTVKPSSVLDPCGSRGQTRGASIARDLNAALNASYDALRGRSLAPSARSGGSGEGPDLDFLNSLSYDLSCGRKQR